MSPSVVFTPEAEDQLAELYRYIAAAGSPEVAARTRRRSSLTARSWPHSRIAAARATTSGLDCAQSASGDASLLHSLCLDETVAIIGVFYGGRDYEAILSDPEGAFGVATRPPVNQDPALLRRVTRCGISAAHGGPP